MVGRDAEIGTIERLLTDAESGRSGALLVEGEPGIGKTTLLDAARSLAGGFTCLSAHGVESESVLAHAGLLELVTPVAALLDEVPAPQADALRAALGWASPEAPTDPFLVAAAVLSLLAAVAEHEPVLVAVDDLQWLDRESAAAILFAARRMGPDAVAFVLTARTDPVAAELLRGVPVLTLDGLSPTAASRLVPAAIPEAVVEQLVSGTAGNPLALLEVSRQLDQAQLVGAAALPDPLPVGERIASYFDGVLSALSPEAWRAVVLFALDQSTAPTTVAAALAASGIEPIRALDEAADHGVLFSDERGMRFRHPLLRTAVLRLATPTLKREAHQTLADALPPESPVRAWHLAETALGADDGLADELARVADRERHRLGFAAAAAAMERSAQLTTSGDLAAERLAAAAEDAFLAGDLARTRTLADRVLAGPAPGSSRGHALFTLGMLEQYAGSMVRSVDHLAESCDLLGGRALVRALAELALARFRLNQLDAVEECADRIDLAVDRTDPEQRLLADFTRGVSHVLRGEPDLGGPKLAAVRELAVSEELRHEPRALLFMALAVGFSGELGEAMSMGVARIDDVRRRGVVGILVPLLAIRSAGRAWAGDHAGAYADAGEAAELADLLGYAADAAVAVEMLAWQLAARGEHDQADAALTRARALIDRAGTSGVAAHYALTVAFCALCRGDVERVADVLEARVAADGGVGAMGEPLGVAPLLVEAYVALGRGAEAAALSARFAELTSTASPPRFRALVERCQALTSSAPETAYATFETALATHREAGDAYEAARTRLLFGERLRRDGRRLAAREQLGAAHTAFSEMDLATWAERAAREIAATGAKSRRGHVGTSEPLTSQETRVALLVAEGRTNKEVAAALFLSPKTVEHHLGSVFRKRGLRSRTELARAFAPLRR